MSCSHTQVLSPSVSTPIPFTTANFSNILRRPGRQQTSDASKRKMRMGQSARPDTTTTSRDGSPSLQQATHNNPSEKRLEDLPSVYQVSSIKPQASLSLPNHQFQLELNKHQETIKKHSFQIVHLQNQIQELQNTMRKEAEDKEKLLAELRRLSDGAATLKGMLAGLKVEFYSGPSLVPRYAPPIAGPPSNPSTPLGPAPSYRSSSSLLDRSFDVAQRPSPVSVIAESVAHKLLSEQKPLLIRGLVSCWEVWRVVLRCSNRCVAGFCENEPVSQR